MTEEQRIFEGRLFASEVPELIAKKSKAHRLSQDYNALYEDDAEARKAILHELLGSVGEGTVMLGPIRFHYGCHTESTDIVMSGEDEYLVDSFLRLIRLLDTPRDIPILAPVIIREIYGRIFWDPHRKMIYHSIYSMRKQYLKASVDYLKNNYMLFVLLNILKDL